MILSTIALFFLLAMDCIRKSNDFGTCVVHKTTSGAIPKQFILMKARHARERHVGYINMSDACSNVLTRDGKKYPPLC